MSSNFGGLPPVSFCCSQMSRIVGPSRLNRAGKQSMLFAQPNQPVQQTTYSGLSIQEDVYNQFTSAINSIQSNSMSETSLQPAVTPGPKHSRKHRHERTAQPEFVRTDNNAGTISLPENFTTVSINPADIDGIQAINTNASFRSLSSNMYEDTNCHESDYKHTVINNMARDVLATAEYLCANGGSDGRSYENQVSGGMIDTSYGAHQMNMLAARRILNQGGQ